MKIKQEDNAGSTRIDTGYLLQKVSGRFMDADIRNMNAHIMNLNVVRKRRHNRSIKLTTLREMDAFLGILLVARLENTTDLWGRRGHAVREETYGGELL